MFVVTNRIPVAEAFEADFEDRFRKRAHLIDRSPGFVKNEILKPVRRRFDHASGAWVESPERGYYLLWASMMGLLAALTWATTKGWRASPTLPKFPLSSGFF